MTINHGGGNPCNTTHNNARTHIDDDLIGPICELADLDITDDYHLNQLIIAARMIRDREGFLVVDGDDLDGISLERS